MEEQQKQFFMNRAFDLAMLGSGKVAPNPLVGCVIVQKGKVIGEGYHQKYGEAHAEVNAVKAVVNMEELEGAEVFVTLEPCSHFGKTPPCADLLISHKVGKVYIANHDPNPLVAGKGIEKLQKAGIKVETGILEEKGLHVNRRFFTSIIHKRPYIILKWAQTADGFVARNNYDSKWISNWLSRKYVHKWRTEESAIMVGTNTAIHDNPQLTARDWQGQHPLRILLDGNLRTPHTHKLFSDGLSTLCYNYKKQKKEGNTEFIKISKNDLILENILSDLQQRKVQTLFIEGGSQLLSSFIEKKLWDEARVFQSETSFIDGIEASKLNGRLIHQETLLNDKLKTFVRL